MYSPKILLLVFLYTFIFLTAAHFYLSPPLLFLITRSSSFSVIHVSVDVKSNIEKDSTLLLLLLFFFFSLNVRVATRFPAQEKLELHLGCHTCWLSYFTLVCLWCGWTGGRTVTWLPKFFGWISNQIFLPMVRRLARFARARALLLIGRGDNLKWRILFHYFTFLKCFQVVVKRFLKVW